ncbi:MAG TPA: S8 family serine peptidase, partial [Kribbellaceae bacterium]|nr:S8 family serine peptidase [Kribbellaceae bacterium]
TASTAGGNNGVTMTVLGRDYGQGSGIAPHARLAIYKALWQNTAGTASGSTADLVKAVDTAVADGVDVINYSISGSSSPTDSVSVAFLRAARAGVFVATSAGNDGPGVSTVSKNYPWVTTVANGTHDREIRTTVTLGNGQSYTGAGIGNGTPAAPIVLAADAAQAGADPVAAARCYPDTLDPAKATGKIVVCDRGVTARVDKSLQVKNAGGIGMVLVNTSPNTLDSDLHSVPTVHLDDVSGAAVKAYAAQAGGTATIHPAEVIYVNASKVASSSSRGPGLPIGGDLLKPDVMAPGTNVLAATTSFAAAGGEYAFFSGTSMASPHIAGMAAVLMAYHPDWSPMAIKSAIMTTATTKDTSGNPIGNDTGSAGNPFGYGAGLMQARPSLEPGLVYDSSYAEWLQFVCGSGLGGSTGGFCAHGKIDPSDLNYPTIAIGDLAGRQTVRRTVRNVTGKAETYTARVEGLAGLGVTVTPQVITVPAGGVASFTVAFEEQNAPLDQYAFGKLTWASKKHTVASVLAVRPQAVKAPARVTGTGTDGSVTVPVTTGYNGTLTTSVGGLVAPVISQATLMNPTGTSFPTTAPAANDHVAKFTVAVPAGTSYLRFATINGDYPANIDIDVYVYRAGTATLVGSSTGGTADEKVDIASPSGSYDVYVDLFAGPEVTANLDQWFVGAAAGNLTVDPASAPATVAGEVPLTVTWSGLEPGKRYLGRLSYSDGATTRGGTLVDVTS